MTKQPLTYPTFSSLPREFRRRIEKCCQRSTMKFNYFCDLYDSLMDENFHDHLLSHALNSRVYDYRNEKFAEIGQWNHDVFDRLLSRVVNCVSQKLGLPSEINIDNIPPRSQAMVMENYTYVSFVHNVRIFGGDFRLCIGHNRNNMIIDVIDTKYRGLAKHIIDILKSCVIIYNIQNDSNMGIDAGCTEFLSKRVGPKLTRDQRVRYFQGQGFNITNRNGKETHLNWSPTDLFDFLISLDPDIRDIYIDEIINDKIKDDVKEYLTCQK